MPIFSGGLPKLENAAAYDIVTSSHLNFQPTVQMREQSPSTTVRQTAHLTASLPEADVKVDPAACHDAAKFIHNILQHRNHTAATVSASWCNANNLHPSEPSSDALKWIFLVDTLNFCFWAPLHCARFTVEYRGNQYTGYWALCASVNRALDESFPITDPAFYATVDEKTLAYIFRPSNGVTIPMLSQRVSVLHEAGTVLQTQFAGSVHNLVASCRGSAQQLIQTLTSCFSSYADTIPVHAVFPDDMPSIIPPHFNTFCFYKRAQIFVADVWACFVNSSQYKFHDIATLTMFADYRVPQILAWLGAIKYSDKVLLALKSGDQLQSGSKWEVEIRGCSIHAVELIRGHVHTLHAQNSNGLSESDNQIPINSILIDFALWDYATQHRDQLDDIPIHRVKSIFY